MSNEKHIDGVTVVYVEPKKKKEKPWDDIDNLKKLIELAFPRQPIIDVNVLYQKTTDGLTEIKISDGYSLYNVSQVAGTVAGSKTNHWIFSVLRVDNEENRVVFKYIHPDTMEVFDDPNLVDIATLPAIC